MKEPTMEEVLELVSFRRDDAGQLYVRNVYGNVQISVHGDVGSVYGDVGNVRGNVLGHICGNVHGSVDGKILNKL